MRVIAGKYRGKILKDFDLSTTKPTLDRVKEALFSSIQFDIVDRVVLDLFSGTGALGIEAISRGAKKVYFVDKELNAIKIIKSNLQNIKEDYEIVNADYLDFLSKKHNENQKFDLVLLDPPFHSDFGIKSLQFLIENDMIENNGVIVYEKLYEGDKELEVDTKKFSVKKKKYGTVEIVILRKV